VPSPSSSVQQARQALGLRLREIRRDASLSARDLAALMGRHPSKISRIEHGHTTPSPADITAWTTHCGAEDQTADLIASLTSLESAYREWRRLERDGMRRLQESYLPLYERTALFRVYEPGVIPGLFQTAAYATARLTAITAFSGIPDDVDQAVAARLDRQRLLHTGARRFAVVLEEWALHCRIGDTEMMAAQLGHLLTVAALPTVSLGIIPSAVDRTMWSSPGFWIFDDDRVLLETPTAEITVTQPREIDVYTRTFTKLSSMAAVGAGARHLITQALADLDRTP
jgi:transcriptional regulator with XRE-family HTH domain